MKSMSTSPRLAASDHHVVHGPEHAALVRGGVAVALGQFHPALQELVLALQGLRRQEPDHVGNRGQFLEYAVRSLAVGLAADDSAFRVGRVGVVADHLQAERVDRCEMAGDMRGDHWHRGRHPVEILAGRMAAEQCVVVAHAEDPTCQCDVRPGGERLQPVHEVVDRIDGTVRRSEQVGPDGLRAELLGVGMAIDEPGHQRLAAEILEHRAVALLRERLCPAASESDLAVVDDDRFDGGGLVAFHRDDRAAVDDEVRRGTWSGGGVLLPAGGHRECGNEDGGNSLGTRHTVFLGYCRAKDRRRG